MGREEIRNKIVDYVKTVQGMWQPMWKNKSAKTMSKDECVAIDRLKAMIKAPFDDIEAVLDIKGEKTLRVKRKYAAENDVDLYDYFIFGPITFDGKHLYYKQAYTAGEIVNNKRVLESIVVMMDEYELAGHIRDAIFAKEAAREADERRRILGRLWGKQA